VTHTRRRLLATLGAGGLAGLAGCESGTGDGPTSTPTGTPTDTERTSTPTATATSQELGISISLPDDPGSTAVTLTGTVDGLGEATSAEVHFEYREAGADAWQTTESQTLTSPATFEAEVTGLNPRQEYEFRAVIETSTGERLATWNPSFTTSPLLDVESVRASSPTAVTVEASANLADGASADVTLEYREVPRADWSAGESQTVTAGEFSHEVSGLTSRRYYEVRATVEAGGSDAVATPATTVATPGEGENSPGTLTTDSAFAPGDGFASATEWLDDDTPVVVVREPTREQLAAALDVAGPRLVVFETSGTIDLDGGIAVEEGQFYLAGQTAPSPGITLVKGGLHLDAEEFVVQHVRVRRGDDTPDAGAGDAVGTSESPAHGVFDHVTATWGTDETLSCYGTDMTIANSIVGEALRNSEFHAGGNGHSAGSLVGSGYERIAMVGNLWASNLTRNPRLQSGTSVVVNNVSYDFRNGINCSANTTSSIVGHAFLRGDVGAPAINMYDTHDGEIHVADSYTRPEQQALVGDGVTQVDSSPVWPEGLEALPGAETEEHVVQNAGARPADRTYHDRRIVHAVVNWAPTDGNLPGGSGLDHAWIDHEEAVGGYPDLPANTDPVAVPATGTKDWLSEQATAVETHDTTYEMAEGPGLVEDFADGDLSAWVGATEQYAVSAADPVASGEYSLESTGEGEGFVASFVDLPRYPRAGDTFAAAVAATETTPVMGVAFGIKSFENCYLLRYWPDAEAIQLLRVADDEGTDPETTTLAESDSLSIEAGTVYDFVVDWGTDGTIDIDLRDADGTTLASLSATDDTHLYGGIGTRRTGMLDDIRILEE